ncbi:cubilin-like [Ornithodoros turicata]|uniref:cubilin-like n=1 Tax=Ornithodoros turicata TaxID=34597 RepID=UPI0031388D39
MSSNRTEPWISNSVQPRFVGVCDYCLFDGEGNFTSYGYPLDYHANQECSYRVKRLPGTCALEIIFHDFDLQDTPGCRADYFKVEGIRFCGQEPRAHREIVEFPKGSDEMSFLFKTDGSKAGRGFWIEIIRRPGNCEPRKNVIGACEERHAEEEFFIWSPNYPQPYGANQKCWYYVRRANERVCGLELTFLSFDLEASDGCVYDYLDVDGQRLCGLITPGAVRVFMFTADQLLIHFSSDSQSHRQGFHIRAKQVTTCYPGNALPPPPLCDVCTQRISDDITSYGFPTEYRNNLLCRITISRPSDAFCYVDMNFLEFDVEKTTSCDHDFLQMDRDRYCGTMLKGQHKQMHYDPDGNAVMVFKTDARGAGKGFRLRFHQVPCPAGIPSGSPENAQGHVEEAKQCDRAFQQREFYIQSPNFPSNYLDNHDCRYIIHKAGDDICDLELVYAAFDVESSPNCQYDYLEIGGNRHCGSLPADHLHTFPFPSNEKVIHFHSNGANTRRGFSIRARQLPCDLRGSSTRHPPQPGPPQHGDPKDQLHVTALSHLPTSPFVTTPEPHSTPRYCDLYMDKVEFEIESMNYPSDYEDQLDCAYTIRRAHGNICQMEITFLDFQLQPSDSCHGDYLAIDDLRVCGTVVSGTTRMMDFKDPQKVMRFHTDDAQTERGFHIMVRQHDCDTTTTPSVPEQIECDETFAKPEAQLISVNYPHNYDNNLECRYTIRKMSSSVCRLEMSFMKFDIESSTDCEYDFLDIDGQKLCGIFTGNTSGMYDFNEDEKVIRFHSDAANSRPGYQIHVRQLECGLLGPQGSPRPPPSRPFHPTSLDQHTFQRKCDKIYTNRLFDIRSLDYPHGYPNNLDCKFIIFQATPDVCKLELTFIDFDVEKEDDCDGDFLELDGDRVCGTLPPDSKRYIQFTESQVVVRFHTDSVSNRPGFHIKVRQLECGKSTPSTNLGKAPSLDSPCSYEFNEGSGVFYSQGFPGPYPNKMFCTYKVIANPGYCKVELSFIQFNLESSGNRPDGQCGQDFMEINGVRYCNRQLEGQIRILHFKGSPPKVTMHFITNDQDAGKGFLGFYKQLECGPPSHPPSFHGPSGHGPGGHSPGGHGHHHFSPPGGHLAPVGPVSPIGHGGHQSNSRQPNCDRLYALPDFQLESPGYPGEYRSGLDCRFFIRRLSERICSLQITFVNFDVEDSPNCYNDYLEIGGEKICGCVPGGQTKEIPLRDFQTTLRFHSNHAIEKQGFVLKVQQMDCRGPSFPGARPGYPGSGHAHLPPPPLYPVGVPASHPYPPPGPGGRHPYFPPHGAPPPHGVPPHGGPPHQLGGAPSQPPSLCDKVITKAHFEIKSSEFKGSFIECRLTIQRQSQDMCRVEFLFVRFEVDCTHDIFRVEDVQICGKLDHYSIRSFNFDGPQKVVYFRSTSEGRASDFVIKGRQISCSGRPPAPEPSIPSPVPGQPGHHGGFPPHGPEYPRHHQPPRTGHPPPGHGYPPVGPPSTGLPGYPPGPSAGTPQSYPPSGHGYPPAGPPPAAPPSYPPIGQPPAGPPSYPPIGPPPPAPPNYPPSYPPSYPHMHGRHPGPAGPPPPAHRYPDPVGRPPPFPAPPQDLGHGGYPRPPTGQWPQHGPPAPPVGTPGGSCDRVYNSLEFTISSPNFPGQYPSQSMCRYIVQRYDSATCAIEILFSKFDMEQNPNCQYEHLEVDGRKLCGTLPENTVQKFNFYQPEMQKVMVFRSDRARNHVGFSIRVRQVTDCGGPGFSPTQDRVAPRPPNPLCDYCQREVRGQLSSPSYPSMYAPDTRCTYRIQPVPGHCEVEMYFHDFDIESSPGCQKDFLEIDKTQRHCGNELVKGMRKVPFPGGAAPEVRILFVADAYGNGKGFHLEYRQLPCKSPVPSSSEDKGTATQLQSDATAFWIKGFQENSDILTASIFVENRNISNPERFTHSSNVVHHNITHGVLNSTSSTRPHF